MKKRILAVGALVLTVLVCGGLVGFNFFRQEMIGQFFANMKQPAQAVSTATVETRTWTPGITAIGTARAAKGVQLATEANGMVKEIRFEANDKVQKGELLVHLDDAVERADLIDAEAAVKINEAALARSKELKVGGFDSEASLDKAQGLLDAARSKLARTKAAIELKALQAPFTGTIGIPRIEVGQYVSAGNVVATLQDLDNMTVDFTVPEQMVAKLRIDQPVRFGLNSTDLDLDGKITGIDPRGDPQTRLVNVRAAVTANPGEDVIPGRFVHVRVDLPKEQGIATVPQTAVVTSLYGDYVYVVVDDGKEGAKPDAKIIRQKFVKPGRREAGEMEIKDGLEAGDIVVTAGQNKLQPGASVTVDNTIDITKSGTVQ